jgi:hypothetical protein
LHGARRAFRVSRNTLKQPLKIAWIVAGFGSICSLIVQPDYETFELTDRYIAVG